MPSCFACGHACLAHVSLRCGTTPQGQAKRAASSTGVDGCAGKQIKAIREKFDLQDAEVNSEQCTLFVTCTQAEVPRAEALILHVKEFIKGVEVGRTYEKCKVRVSPTFPA